MIHPPPDTLKMKLGWEPEFLSELVNRLSKLNLIEKEGSITAISQTRDKLEEAIRQLSDGHGAYYNINKLSYKANFSKPEVKPYYPRT